MPKDEQRAAIDLQLATAYVESAARPCAAGTADCDRTYLARSVALLRRAVNEARRRLAACGKCGQAHG